MSSPTPPPKGGMSLYANLLNPKPDSSASISSAPVLYDHNDKDDSAKKDVNSGTLQLLQLLSSFKLLYRALLRDLELTLSVLPFSALRFQPIRRPQVTQKRPTKPTSFPKSIPAAPGSTASDATAAAAAVAPPATTGTPPPQQRSTLADWAATHDEDEFLYAAQEKRQRGGRKAAKKRKRQTEQRETDWDEIYDPARPTNVDEYLRSEERVREVQDWKAVLYAHRKRRGTSEDGDSEDSESEMMMGGGSKSFWSSSDNAFYTANSTLSCLTGKFAPPASYSFAPPPPASPPRDSPVPPPPAAATASVSVPNDATGDDAYARRLALSGMGAPPPPPPTHTPTPPPPPPPQQDSTTISRAPVRYEALPPPPPADEMDIDNDDEDYDSAHPPNLGLGASTTIAPQDEQRRTNLPGQKGFAQRLMSKYGWTAGSGLGAESSGIVNPLSVKVEKRRKKPDAEGGGFAEPGGRGKIIGGKTASNAESDAGKFGPMSEVIVLRNMLEGMENLQDEINDGLGQEIGEECGDKYGRVERLYIDVEGRQVFIKFTDAVSALRAVNALEGRVFNGNAIAARFWDGEKFERGEYS